LTAFTAEDAEGRGAEAGDQSRRVQTVEASADHSSRREAWPGRRRNRPDAVGTDERGRRRDRRRHRLCFRALLPV